MGLSNKNVEVEIVGSLFGIILLLYLCSNATSSAGRTNRCSEPDYPGRSSDACFGLKS